jgi:hypothetical protein
MTLNIVHAHSWHVAPQRCLATAIATGRRVAASPRRYLVLCRCLARGLILYHCLAATSPRRAVPRRCLIVPLYVVLCEFNEPHSQSFGVGAQICSECVSILILSSIFKHYTNLKNLLAGGASVIGNCTAQVNLWE